MGSVTVKKEVTQKYSAKETCKEAFVLVTVERTFGTKSLLGHRVGPAEKVNFVPKEAGAIDYRNLPADIDGCGLALHSIPTEGRVPHNLLKATGGEGDALTDIFAVERTVSGSVSIPVPFASGAVLLSIGFKRSTTRKTQVVTTFLPGAHYYGYPPSNAIEFERCWSVVKTA
jgi:hypothetical protein